MAALTQDLSIDSEIAHVDEALIAGEAYTIGDEVIRASHALIEEWDDVAGAGSGLRWFIERGEDHTTPASHSSGATLTLARKYGEGGAGEQTVYVQPTDPGAVGADKIWVRLFEGEVPGLFAAGAIYRRTDDDSEWEPVPLGVFDDAGNLRALIRGEPDQDQPYMIGSIIDDEGVELAGFRLDENGLDLQPVEARFSIMGDNLPGSSDLLEPIANVPPVADPATASPEDVADVLNALIAGMIDDGHMQAS